MTTNNSNPFAPKLTNRNKTEIVKAIGKGVSVRSLAKKYNVSRGTIKFTLRRKTANKE